MPFVRTVRWVRLAAALAVAACGVNAVQAIITRHDRDDAAYRALGERHPEVVSILPDGTGVLIAPRWVLTAAHVAQGVADREPRVEVSGVEIGVSDIFLHPQWEPMGPHDIALLQLARPVSDVQPAALYAKGDEVGQVVTFVGRGDHGTGLTGPQTMDRVKRGATNTVVEADDDWLFFNFDRGAEATELEGVSGPGDSGGPALLALDGTTYTLGVSVFADGDQGPGRYGVREGYTRVSTHRGWVEDVLAGKVSPRRPVTDGRGGPQKVAVAPAGGTALPDDAAGRLVADYVEAYNSNDDQTMLRFIHDRFEETYRQGRSDAEHLALYRRLRDELFGSLRLSGVREASAQAITVLFETDKEEMAEFRFDLQPGDPPSIAGLRVSRVRVSRR